MDAERERTGIEMTQQETTEKNTAESREDSIHREYDFAPDVKLKECRFCCVMIPKKARVCPNCRMSLRRHWFRNLIAAVFAVMVIGGGGFYLSEHWGIMKDAVASVWRAQDGSAMPVVAMTTVDTTKTGASAVETSEVTSMTEEREIHTADSKDGENSTEQDDDIDTGDSTDQTENSDTEAADSQKSTEDRKDTEDDADAATTAGAANDDRFQPAMEKQDGNPAGEATETAEDAGNTEDTKDPESVPAARNMDRQEETFREECTLVGYKSLLRDTERYLGTALMAELQVVCQVEGGLFDDNIYYLCKTEDGNDITRYYIVRDDRETDDTLILEGDILTVFGRLFGTCKIPAGLLETRPIVPALSMLYYDLTGE